MSDKILWRSNSGRRDWRHGAPLSRLLGEAGRLGLVGQAARVEGVGIDPPALLAAQPGVALANAILATPADGAGVVEIVVSGTEPAPWELFWNVYPFSHERQELDGFNTLWLTFDRSRVTGTDGSAALMEAFRATCTDDTEYAMIHPYDHWSSFAERFYEVPVTINLQFKGVFWANYLGPGHLEEFDSAKLARLQANQMRWVDGPGLVVFAAPDLASADAPESERELLRLTQGFRDALTPESLWRRGNDS